MWASRCESLCCCDKFSEQFMGLGCSRSKPYIMKNDKLIKALLAPSSGVRTPSLIALGAGLAAGAILGILLAPNSGSALRTKISDSVKGLFGGDTTQEEAEPEVTRQPSQINRKKPKSDIRTILHDAHSTAAHTE
jgi:gas vesicle protein